MVFWNKGYGNLTHLLENGLISTYGVLKYKKYMVLVTSCQV